MIDDFIFNLRDLHVTQTKNWSQSVDKPNTMYLVVWGLSY